MQVLQTVMSLNFFKHLKSFWVPRYIHFFTNTSLADRKIFSFFLTNTFSTSQLLRKFVLVKLYTF